MEGHMTHFRPMSCNLNHWLSGEIAKWPPWDMLHDFSLLLADADIMLKADKPFFFFDKPFYHHNSNKLMIIRGVGMCVCVCVCVCARARARMHMHSIVSDSLWPHGLGPPSSSVLGIFQARTLERVAISYSRGPSQPRDQTHVSCISYIGRWIFYHCAAWEAIIRLMEWKGNRSSGS